MEKLIRIATHTLVLRLVYSLAGFITAIQSYSIGRYNNYQIFKQSYYNLLSNKDLYLAYPEQYYDLYKYSPTFAVGMAPFALLSDVFGLILWNLTNSLSLLCAIQALPIKPRQKAIVSWIVLIELITSLQNAQTNALLAAGLLGAFVLLERSKMGLAGIGIVAGGFIKLFSGVGILLGLLYPKKLIFGTGLLVWGILLAVFPLAFISIDVYWAQLLSWKNLLINDESTSIGISLMGVLHGWWGCKLSNTSVQLFGLAILLPIFLAGGKKLNLVGRLQALALLLLWLVIFNHKAESPTFVIAVVGAALWYSIDTQTVNWLKQLALISLFVLTILSPTDIFPLSIRQNYIIPYALKALPCIFIAFYILIQLYYRILSRVISK